MYGWMKKWWFWAAVDTYNIAHYAKKAIFVQKIFLGFYRSSQQLLDRNLAKNRKAKKTRESLFTF